MLNAGTIAGTPCCGQAARIEFSADSSVVYENAALIFSGGFMRIVLATKHIPGDKGVRRRGNKHSEGEETQLRNFSNGRQITEKHSETCVAETVEG